MTRKGAATERLGGQRGGRPDAAALSADAIDWQRTFSVGHVDLSCCAPELERSALQACPGTCSCPRPGTWAWWLSTWRG